MLWATEHRAPQSITILYDYIASIVVRPYVGLSYSTSYIDSLYTVSTLFGLALCYNTSPPQDPTCLGPRPGGAVHNTRTLKMQLPSTYALSEEQEIRSPKLGTRDFSRPVSENVKGGAGRETKGQG